MSLIIDKLGMSKLLIYNQTMHNQIAMFSKFLNICKQVLGNQVN